MRHVRNFVLLASLGLAGSALAVFPRPRDASNNPFDANDPNFAFVGLFGGASAVAVDTRWVLTAAHVNGSTFQLPRTDLDHAYNPAHTGGSDNDFVSYSVVQNVTADEFGGKQPDLRLLQVDRDLPGFYKVDTRTQVGDVVTMVGFGGSGDENPDGVSGYTLNVGGGYRRSATNRIEGFTDITFNPNPPYTPFWETMVYNLSAPGDPTRTAREGGIYSGDSGGGFFQNFGGGPALVAINDAIDGPNGSQDYGAYGATGYGVYLGSPESKAFLNRYVPQAVVPEPASLAALGLGALALLRRRRA